MQGFTLLPMSQNIPLVAGETYEGFVTVANPVDAITDLDFFASVTPYSVLDAEYTADLATISNFSQIVDWIEIMNPTGTLAPNENTEVHFKITVPESAPSGGQYATIAVQTSESTPATGTATIKNIFQMASIIFASVEGETIHEGEITSINIPGFSTTPRLSVSSSFTNSGNVHEPATTSITAKNLLTGAIITARQSADRSTDPAQGEAEQADIATPGAITYAEYIMPGSTRLSSHEVGGLGGLGIYEITQSIDYLGQTSAITKTVIICPIWFMLLFAATIAAIIGAIIHKSKKRKADRIA